MSASIGLAVGDIVADVARRSALTRDSLVRYAGASGDFNPIHYRDDVAAAVGLPGVLAHGMLTMGIAVQPGRRLGRRPRPRRSTTSRASPAPWSSPDEPTAPTSIVAAKVGAARRRGQRARIDLTVTFGDQTVLGKAQAAVVSLALIA